MSNGLEARVASLEQQLSSILAQLEKIQCYIALQALKSVLET